MDPAGNELDGESNAAQPNGAPSFPSGNGIPGGNFVARFTVDSRPEIAVWSGGSEYIDTNGNFTWDPANADASNRDIAYVFGLASDKIFAGNFDYPQIGASNGTGDGFSKLAAYGLSGSQYYFKFAGDNGTMVWQTSAFVQISGMPQKQINGLPVAGNFSHTFTTNSISGATYGNDTVGLFDGKDWWLDATNPANDAGATSIGLNQEVTAWHAGYPIVGDFNGDGHTDLGEYSNGVFYLQLWTSKVVAGYGHYNGFATVTIGVNNGIQLVQIRGRSRPP